MKDTYGKEWDEMFPPKDYYQVMHLKLFPKKLVHAENLAGEIDKVSNPRVDRLLPAARNRDGIRSAASSRSRRRSRPPGKGKEEPLINAK